MSDQDTKKQADQIVRVLSCFDDHESKVEFVAHMIESAIRLRESTREIAIAIGESRATELAIKVCDNEAEHWTMLADSRLGDPAEHRERRLANAQMARELASKILNAQNASKLPITAPCPHPERKGRHEAYVDGDYIVCRACGARSMWIERKT